MTGPEREDTRLARTLQELAQMEDAVEAPSRVEAAVMARWDSRRNAAKTGRARAGRVVRGTAATAAGITLIGALAWPRTDPRVERSVDPVTSAAAESGATSGTAVVSGVTSGTPVVSGFSQTSTASEYRTVAVVGGPLMAGEPLRVVRMRVAFAALGDLGIASRAQPGHAQAETVDIDVLVGEDGVARGVRVPVETGL